MPSKKYYVYIVSNKYRNVVYIGMTGDLETRAEQHKNLQGSAFSTKYKTTDLIYYECFENPEDAIARETL